MLSREVSLALVVTEIAGMRDGVEGRTKREEIHVHISLIHFGIQQKYNNTTL